MNLYLESLGCAKNQVESEVMLGRLQGSGWTVCDHPEDAHVIVVNTCSFIESAADESIDTILALAKYKQTGRCQRLIVAGCLPERYGEDVVAALPEVDLFLGTGAYDQILKAVAPEANLSGCLLPDPNQIALQTHATPRAISPGHVAYLKIAEGCNQHCTYCIIPKLKGRHRSRPEKDLLQEARALFAAGIKEIILVAQETTAYGRDLVPPTDVATLLQNLSLLAMTLGEKDIGSSADSVQGPDPSVAGMHPWIRLLYAHPQSIDAKTIETIASHPAICDYIDIPIQHASDRVLKRMGRNYSSKDLYRLVDTIRAKAPQTALRTTIMVGFPGESDQDFRQLMDFIEYARFDHLGAFTYSDSEDLAAYALGPKVAETVARERHDCVMSYQRDIASRRNQSYIGRELTILVEDSPEKGIYVGRSSFQAPEVDGLTYVHSHGLTVGEFTQVVIKDALAYDLVGEVKHP